MDRKLDFCVYCGREKVRMAPPTSDVTLPDAETAFPVCFTSIGMCRDCAEITGRFIVRGLMAFRKELAAIKAQRNSLTRRPMTDGEIRLQVESFLNSIQRNG